MGVMDRFERRLDRMVSGTFARAFKSEVQPVEVAAALQRECDDRAAIVTRGRTMVPNEFDVELGQHDYDRLAMYAEPLGAELAAMVREHADEQGYQFVGPVVVRLVMMDDLETGMFRILSGAVASGPTPETPAVTLAPAEVAAALEVVAKLCHQVQCVPDLHHRLKPAVQHPVVDRIRIPRDVGDQRHDGFLEVGEDRLELVGRHAGLVTIEQRVVGAVLIPNRISDPAV